MKAIIVATLAILLWSPPGTCSTLSLEEVLQSVINQYPLVRGAQQDLEKSQYDHLSAQGGFDPVLKSSILDTSLGYYNNTYYDVTIEQPTPLWGTKLVAGYRKGLGSYPIYDLRYQTFDQGELRLGIDLPLLRGGWIDERRTKIRSTEAGIKAAEQNLLSKQLEAKREAARKYWDWVAAGRKWVVSKEMLEIALARDQALITRIKNGDAAQIDHTDNQRAVVQRQAGVVSAQRSLQKASLELSLYYRDNQGVPILPSEDQLPLAFPEPATETSMNRDPSTLNSMATNHPDTQALAFQIEQLNFEQSLARNQVLPRLDINVGFVKDFGLNPGNVYLPPTNYPYELKASLQFELPLFLRTARGRLNSVSASQQKMSLIQELTRDRIKTLVLDSSQAMEAAMERINYAHQEVVLAKKLESAEKIRFQQGDSSLLIINIREQSTRDAMNKEIEALADFFKAKIDYQTYTATSLQQTFP